MMTDYILSPCSLAARGLSQLMVNAAKRPVELPVEGVSLRELTAVKRIVVFLPDDPLWMLTTLRQAARLLDQALQPLPMLILSRSPAIWLWQTLLYQVSHPDRLRNVHTPPICPARSWPIGWRTHRDLSGLPVKPPCSTTNEPPD